MKIKLNEVLVLERAGTFYIVRSVEASAAAEEGGKAGVDLLSEQVLAAIALEATPDRDLAELIRCQVHLGVSRVEARALLAEAIREAFGLSGVYTAPGLLALTAVDGVFDHATTTCLPLVDGTDGAKLLARKGVDWIAGRIGSELEQAMRRRDERTTA